MPDDEVYKEFGVKYTFRYCPRCGAASEEREIGGQVVPVCTSDACGYIFWQNSKPCTCAVLENGRGEVLLCVRAHEPDKGKLDLPGGFLEWAEHPLEAVHREVKEELGVRIEVEAFLGFVMDRYDHEEVATLNIPFLGRIVEGEPTPADDVAEIRWRRLEDIDRGGLAFRNNEIILFDHYASYRAGRVG